MGWLKLNLGEASTIKGILAIVAALVSYFLVVPGNLAIATAAAMGAYTTGSVVLPDKLGKPPA